MKIRTTISGLLLVASLQAMSLAVADETTNHQHTHANMEKNTNPDAHFLDMMSMHHKDGIKMAAMAADKAQTKEVKAVADKIIKDQEKELQQMQAWRDRKFSSVAKSDETLPKMDMSKLEDAKGKAFDQEFTKMMAQHHEDGIKMAKEFTTKLEDQDIKKFAEKMSSNQMKEKEHLKHLQSSLSKQTGRSTSSQM
jgi:uncharacterized protein (DUF305 family)